jgi:ABC-type polysaccharide/polyol phosphate export permease
MDIKRLMDYRDLFYMITWREVKIKYKQSIMGFLWALFMPVIIISAGILVKYAMAKVSGTQFLLKDVASVSVKAIPWTFFISSIKFSTNSLASNFSLVTKINFPKIIFPISAVFSQLIDFCVALFFLMIFLFANGYGFGTKALFALIPLVILVILSIALGILLSAANLFFRDVKYIVEVLVTFAIFFTPVFYEVKLFEKWQTILLLNPVAPLLEGLNGCLVIDQIPYLGWILYSGVFSIVLLFIAIIVFDKVEPMFAEYI